MDIHLVKIITRSPLNDIFYLPEANSYVSSSTSTIIYRQKINNVKPYYCTYLKYADDNPNDGIMYYIDIVVHINIELCLKQMLYLDILAKLYLDSKKVSYNTLTKFKYSSVVSNEMDFNSRIKYLSDNHVKIYDLHLIPFKKKAYDVINYREIPYSHVDLEFKRKGGIIRTDDPGEIFIQKFDDETTLMIKPNNIKSDGLLSRIIDYNELKKVKKSYKQIVLREFHIENIDILYDYLNNYDCDTIWIINTLPLKYYFCPVNNVITKRRLYLLLKIWTGFSQEKTKKKSIAIMDFLFNNFKLMNININHIMCDNIVFVKSSLHSNETHIFSLYRKIYNDWNDKLDYNENNIYSYASPADKEKIKNNLFCSFLFFVCKTARAEEIPEYFRKKNKKLETLLSISNNCESYCVKNTSCPVCYDDGKEMIMNICGHTLCTECFINSICFNNKCPSCRKFMSIGTVCMITDNRPSIVRTIDDIARGVGTVLVMCKNKYSSELVKIYKNNNSVFVCSEESFFSHDIDHIDRVILIDTNPHSRFINRWAGYFNSFEYAPIVYSLVFPVSF